MPSRPFPPPQDHHRHHPVLLPIFLPITLSLVLTLLFALFLLLLLYRKLTLKRTTPSDNHQRRFSSSLLCHSTSSFSSTLLDHGGFGSVYKATLPSGQYLALKLLDSPGSLQGEREFHNELSIASALHSPYILSLLGFSSDPCRHKLILVYEYMSNRSLQDALLDNKCSELMGWKKRFDIVLDIATSLSYLYHSCHPLVIHDNIKPNNILLDANFKAKIGDFGLAMLKTEDLVDKREGGVVEAVEDNRSILEETESVTTGFDEASGMVVNRSAESLVVGILDSEASPEYAAVSPEAGIDEAMKDYVMEWIGSEIKKERPTKSEWIESSSSMENDGLGSKIEQKQRKRLGWWASDEERISRRKEKNRKPREWWKEELSKKTKKKK
ncbi:hypothetical protein I3760_14G086900 [Carya illinoinensis]|nr:hypothetical protein I3760_14G086900 [Carya illinoinensis]